MQQIGDLLGPVIEHGTRSQVFDSFPELASAAWENNPDDVIIFGAGTPLSLGYLGTNYLNGTLGQTGNVGTEVTIGVIGAGALRSFWHLHKRYGPKSLFKGIYNVVKTAAAEQRLELPPSHRGLCTFERARKNYYIIDPPFYEPDGGRFEQELFEHGKERFGIDLDELKDIKRVYNEDLPDNCRYIHLIHDPREDNDYLKSFLDDRFDGYTSLDDLVAQDLLYRSSPTD